MNKKILLFLNILYLGIGFTFATSAESNGSGIITKSIPYNTLSECNSDREKYNEENPDASRSACYKVDVVYYYNYCDDNRANCPSGENIGYGNRENNGGETSEDQNLLNSLLEVGDGGNRYIKVNPYKEEFDKININLKAKVLKFIENRKKDSLKNLKITSKSFSKILEEDKIKIKGEEYILSKSKIIGPIFGYVDFELKKILEEKKGLSEEEAISSFFGGGNSNNISTNNNTSTGVCNGIKPTGEGVFLSKDEKKGKYINWNYDKNTKSYWNCAWKCKSGYVREGNGCKKDIVKVDNSKRININECETKQDFGKISFCATKIVADYKTKDSICPTGYKVPNPAELAQLLYSSEYVDTLKSPFLKFFPKSTYWLAGKGSEGYNYLFTNFIGGGGTKKIVGWIRVKPYMKNKKYVMCYKGPDISMKGYEMSTGFDFYMGGYPKGICKLNNPELRKNLGHRYYLFDGESVTYYDNGKTITYLCNYTNLIKTEKQFANYNIDNKSDIKIGGIKNISSTGKTCKLTNSNWTNKDGVVVDKVKEGGDILYLPRSHAWYNIGCKDGEASFGTWNKCEDGYERGDVYYKGLKQGKNYEIIYDGCVKKGLKGTTTDKTIAETKIFTNPKIGNYNIGYGEQKEFCLSKGYDNYTTKGEVEAWKDSTMNFYIIGNDLYRFKNARGKSLGYSKVACIKYKTQPVAHGICGTEKFTCKQGKMTTNIFLGRNRTGIAELSEQGSLTYWYCKTNRGISAYCSWDKSKNKLSTGGGVLYKKNFFDIKKIGDNDDTKTCSSKYEPVCGLKGGKYITYDNACLRDEAKAYKIENHKCNKNIVKQGYFIAKGKAFYSNGKKAFCYRPDIYGKYQAKKSGLNYKEFPHGMRYYGTCSAVRDKENVTYKKGYFSVRGRYFKSNGIKQFCYLKKKPNGQISIKEHLPYGMAYTGYCLSSNNRKYKKGYFKVGNTTYYSNGSSYYCKSNNVYSSSQVDRGYGEGKVSEFPGGMTNKGECYWLKNRNKKAKYSKGYFKVGKYYWYSDGDKTFCREKEKLDISNVKPYLPYGMRYTGICKA